MTAMPPLKSTVTRSRALHDPSGARRVKSVCRSRWDESFASEPLGESRNGRRDSARGRVHDRDAA
jgi:hypothetical protein